MDSETLLKNVKYSKQNYYWLSPQAENTLLLKWHSVNGRRWPGMHQDQTEKIRREKKKKETGEILFTYLFFKNRIIINIKFK